MLCIIDNYDSFTYNLVHFFGELGVEARVILNDAMSADEVMALSPSHIVLSPGAGSPADSGVSRNLVRLAAFSGVPLLGVCLGHQVIGEVFGGRVVHASRVMHGKTSVVRHDNTSVFAKLPSPFEAARYHSLIVEQSSLPSCLRVTAWTRGLQNGQGHAAGSEVQEIMGFAHRSLPIHGVQFHPESIMSEHGHALLDNFLCMEKRAPAPVHLPVTNKVARARVHIGDSPETGARS